MGLILDLLFNFAFECFHFLSWPLFAIGYPLCASIQAIETNSNNDTEKLITYWICLSLILLFEHAFQQLMYWLPYWPYMKLVIVCFLVTPHFDGSFYVYNQLVRPFLSMKPHVVFNRLIKLLETLEQDNPLTEAKRESKETEPKALQNLIASKVRQTEPDFALPRTATYAEIAAARILGRKDLPDLKASKKLQNEWICATSDQRDLISQLQVKRYADESQKLKPKVQERNVSAANPAETGAEMSDSTSSQALWTCVLCKVKCRRKFDLISHFQGQRHAKALESLKARPDSKYYFKPWTCGICQRTLKHKNELISHLQSKRHSVACEQQKVEEMSGKGEASSASSENNPNVPKCEAMNLKSSSVVEVRDCKWWCTICNVSCTCEENMKHHLHGSKHSARTT